MQAEFFASHLSKKFYRELTNELVVSFWSSSVGRQVNLEKNRRITAPISTIAIVDVRNVVGEESFETADAVADFILMNQIGCEDGLESLLVLMIPAARLRQSSIFRPSGCYPVWVSRQFLIDTDTASDAAVALVMA